MSRGDEAILKSANTPLEMIGAIRLWLAEQANSAVATLLQKARVKPFSSRKILVTSAGLAVAVLLVTSIVRHRSGPAAVDASTSVRFAGGRAVAAPKQVASSSPRLSQPFAADYKILLSRSIFASNGIPGSGGGSREQSSITAEVIPPSTFALKGISQEDASFTAFIEDTSARRMMQLHAGDTVGQGQVRDITLQALNYDVGGKVVHVEIGQGLDGNPFIASAVKPSSDLKPERKHKHNSGNSDVRASTEDDGH